jgi:UDP-xylose/UDP-N-acetylglucosamine transporter B4
MQTLREDSRDLDEAFDQKFQLNALSEDDAEDDTTPAAKREAEQAPNAGNPTQSQQVSLLSFVVAFSGVVLGGVGTYVCFEKLNQLDPGCGGVITLLQYIVAVAERSGDAAAFVSKPVIPYPYHFAFCFLLFAGSWLGNVCLEFDLPFPLFLVIKNCSLVFTLIVGGIFLGKHYRLGHIVSVIVVSAGVTLAVLEQQQVSKRNPAAETSSRTLIGVMLCTLSTLAMAGLSCSQEYAFAKYKLKSGETPTKEAMFFTHVFGLPALVMSGSLVQHITALASEWKSAFPLILMNVSCMVMCKTNIFRLLEISTSLTTTLAITVSRFLGIIVSVCFLSKVPAGSQFWIGSLLVASGSIGYLMVGQKPKEKQA